MGPDAKAALEALSHAVHRLVNQHEPNAAWALIFAKGDKMQVIGCVKPLEAMPVFLAEASRLMAAGSEPMTRIEKPVDN